MQKHHSDFCNFTILQKQASIQMAGLTRLNAYLDIVPAIAKGKDNAVLSYVLLDSRSDKTFCECGIVNELRV